MKFTPELAAALKAAVRAKGARERREQQHEVALRQRAHHWRTLDILKDAKEAERRAEQAVGKALMAACGITNEPLDDQTERMIELSLEVPRG